MLRRYFLGWILIIGCFMAPVSAATVSLAPFIEYHQFDSDLPLGDGDVFGVGIQARTYLSHNLSLEASLARFSSFTGVNGVTLQNYTAMSYGLSYYLDEWFNRVYPFVSVGMASDFSDLRDEQIMYYGGGMVFKMSEEVSSRATIHLGEDISLSLALETHFDGIDILSGITLGDDSPLDFSNEEDIVEETYIPVAMENSSYLVLPDVLYNFIRFDAALTDISSHWAVNDIRDVVGYYLMVPPGANFKPNTTLPTSEGSRVVALATYITRLLKKSTAPMTYSVLGEPGNAYFVDLYVTDHDGNMVSRLLSREPHYIGDYDISWDGRDDYGRQVDSGFYHVNLVVYDDLDTVVLETSGKIDVYAFNRPSFDMADEALKFNNTVEVDWGRTVLERSLDLRLIEDGGFDAKPMTKVEFIIAVAKGLKILGATVSSVPDLDLYKDKDQIPSYSMNYLNLYIEELGYGGVKEKSTLEPRKNITRAEAAVILNRLLDWRYDVDVRD